MRRVGSAAVVVLLLSTSVAVAEPPLAVDVAMDVRPTPRAGVAVDGDDGFTNEEAGVRSGSGSAADPYVISDWTVLQDSGDAVRIVDTSAHVVLRDLVILGSEGEAGRFLTCATGPCMPEPVSIRIVNASNVTVERARIFGGREAFFIHESRDIRVLDSAISPPARAATRGVDEPFRQELIEWGIEVSRSAGVTIAGVAVGGTRHPIFVYASQNVTVEDSTMRSTPGGLLQFTDTTDVRIVRNVFEHIEILLTKRTQRTTIAENDFRKGPMALTSSSLLGPVSVTGLEFCGNDVREMTDPDGSVVMFGLDGAVIRGNRFVDNERGLQLPSRNLTFEHNLVADSSTYGISIASDGARIHNNSFTGNPLGERITRTSDARFNWWGHASGPSGVRPGEGGPLFVGSAEVPYSPWLTSPPDLVVDCVPEETRGAPDHVVAVSGAASAALAVHVSEDVADVHVHAHPQVAVAVARQSVGVPV